MEKLTAKSKLLLVGSLLLETIIMFWAILKANGDETEVQVRLMIGIPLALMISLAVLIKDNQAHRKAIIPIFSVCAATYLQIAYCSIFYKWSAVCLTLPIIQLMFCYLTFKLSNTITALFSGCSNLMFATI